MKKIKDDGTVTYYYYKKKRGRHKKTGPKKKKLKRGPKKPLVWNYKIITVSNRKQNGYIGVYHNVIEANDMKDKLLKNNDSIQIPVKYVSTKNGKNSFSHYNGEYLILEKMREGENKTNETYLRNEYGKLILNKTTSNKWRIYDKIPFLKEETFWVYGFNPRVDRKPIQWICENLIDNTINNSNNVIIQIYLYNNKVIFKYDYDTIEFVVCKNISDAIRVYNYLENKYKSEKQVIFTGITYSKNKKTAEIVSLLKEKTGWSLYNIYKTNTLK